MANSRNPKRKGHDTSRDPGGFVAVPWSVMDCPAYARLSHPAKALLLEIARQFVRDNNGRLLASQRYLESRGWKSSDVVTRAKRELLDAGFIHETVTGHRPNKASWYALTWRSLDKLPGFDQGAEASFERGAYMKTKSTKIDVLTPSPGAERALIAPSPGAGKRATAPSPGAIEAVLTTPPAPSPGDHLEKPSAAVVSRPAGLGGPAVRTPASATTIGRMLAGLRPSNRPPGYAAARARLSLVHEHEPRSGRTLELYCKHNGRRFSFGLAGSSEPILVPQIAPARASLVSRAGKDVFTLPED